MSNRIFFNWFLVFGELIFPFLRPTLKLKMDCLVSRMRWKQDFSSPQPPTSPPLNPPCGQPGTETVIHHVLLVDRHPWF